MVSYIIYINIRNNRITLSHANTEDGAGQVLSTFGQSKMEKERQKERFKDNCPVHTRCTQ